MFLGRSVLVTGATGFIGKALLEKLLRTYVGIVKIYVLIRERKNMSPQERLKSHLLADPIFDKVRSMSSQGGLNLLDKIQVIDGDIAKVNLGINASDMAMLVNDESLSIVYHVAATVKFDEPLKVAIEFNLIATKTLIELCKKLKNLVAFCHVSTAYVNSNIQDNSLIEEKLYPIEQSAHELIEMSQTCPKDLLEKMTPTLLAARPNTYTFTKALAEHLIAEVAPEMPVAIVRPSIVVAAWREPIPGWIQNLSGPTGFLLASLKGLLRSMHVTRECVADIIPVDVCVNTLISASYYVAKNRNKQAELSTLDKCHDNTRKNQAKQSKRRQISKGHQPSCDPKHLMIFHCTSGDVNPVTFATIERIFFSITQQYPSRRALRYPGGSFKRNKFHDLLSRLFEHYLPALLLDLVCLSTGHKMQFLSIYRRLHKAASVVAYFSNNNFRFETKNTNQLAKFIQDPRDKQDLPLSIKELNWAEYSPNYVLGVRRFLLKESDETLESSRRSLNR